MRCSILPSRLAACSVMDIVVCLRSLGLGKYEAVFRENEIDDTVLPNLTAEDLKELGVTALRHRGLRVERTFDVHRSRAHPRPWPQGPASEGKNRRQSISREETSAE